MPLGAKLDEVMSDVIFTYKEPSPAVASGAKPDPRLVDAFAPTQPQLIPPSAENFRNNDNGHNNSEHDEDEKNEDHHRESETPKRTVEKKEKADDRRKTIEGPVSGRRKVVEEDDDDEDEPEDSSNREKSSRIAARFVIGCPPFLFSTATATLEFVVLVCSL